MQILSSLKYFIPMPTSEAFESIHELSLLRLQLCKNMAKGWTEKMCFKRRFKEYDIAWVVGAGP